MADPGSQRQVARDELALEATRRPEFRQVLRASGAPIRTVMVATVTDRYTTMSSGTDRPTEAVA